MDNNPDCEHCSGFVDPPKDFDCKDIDKFLDWIEKNPKKKNPAKYNALIEGGSAVGYSDLCVDCLIAALKTKEVHIIKKI